MEINKTIKSWNLSVSIDEINTTYKILVRDSTVVSNLVIQVINKLNMKYDWNEFALWCSSETVWLLPKFANLSHFHLNSSSKVHFIRRFRLVNIQLPDLQIRQMILDFSKTVFKTTEIICKKLGISHYEELSLQWRSVISGFPTFSKIRKSKLPNNPLMNTSNWSLKTTSRMYDSFKRRNVKDNNFFFRTLSIQHTNLDVKMRAASPITPTTPDSIFSQFNSQNFNDSQNFECFETAKLSKSPLKEFEQAEKDGDIIIYKRIQDKCTLSPQWLTSELTLIEQDITDFDGVLLLLRYKYHNYYFFNENLDSIRINQIFQQAKWSILSGETSCTEDEALVFGGLLLQINSVEESEQKTSEDPPQISPKHTLDDEIDSMLNDLSLHLLGRIADGTEEPTDEKITISGDVIYRKYPASFLFKFKKAWAEMRDDGIYLFKKHKHSKPTFMEKIILRGNDIKMTVCSSKIDPFILEMININNKVDDYIDNSVTEKYKFKFFDKHEFIKWTTACRLATKGIDYALLSNFQLEYHIVNNIIELKLPRKNSFRTTILTKDDEKIVLNNIIGPIYNKPFKRKWNLENILTFQKSFKHFKLNQAKIAYIKCWLALPNAGMRYFKTMINGLQNEQVIGISYNRLVQIDIDTIELFRIWELSKIISWNTNWELGQTELNFTRDKIAIRFQNSKECQMFHEYVGGYLFIMMRNTEKHTNLSENMFHKLTARNISKV